MMYSDNKSYGLDFIRVIASLLVFIPHIIINFSETQHILNIAYLTSIVGVELFFCLSGYLICKQGLYIVNAKQNCFKNAVIFIKRRIFRTWPTYFFALFCYIIFYNFYQKELTYYFFFSQNLFYPMVSSTFFSVSWSICVEELFYFLFPLLLFTFILLYRKVTKKKINSHLLIISTCLLIIIIIYLIRDVSTYSNWGSQIRRVAFLRIDAIAFGGIGYYFLFYIKKYKYLNTCLITLSLISITITIYYLYQYLINLNFNTTVILNNYIFYSMYLFSVCIIILFDRLIKVSKKYTKIIISELSLWAYPLYLIHILIIGLVKNLEIDNIVFNVVAIIIINFSFAYLIRKYIELPFIMKRPIYFKN